METMKALVSASERKDKDSFVRSGVRPVRWPKFLPSEQLSLPLSFPSDCVLLGKFRVSLLDKRDFSLFAIAEEADSYLEVVKLRDRNRGKLQRELDEMKKKFHVPPVFIEIQTLVRNLKGREFWLNLGLRERNGERQ